LGRASSQKKKGGFTSSYEKEQTGKGVRLGERQVGMSGEKSGEGALNLLGTKRNFKIPPKGKSPAENAGIRHCDWGRYTES